MVDHIGRKARFPGLPGASREAKKCDSIARNGFFRLKIATVSHGTAFFAKKCDSVARNGLFIIKAVTVSHGTTIFVLRSVKTTTVSHGICVLD